jgi:hypothetical protein
VTREQHVDDLLEGIAGRIQCAPAIGLLQLRQVSLHVVVCGSGMSDKTYNEGWRGGVRFV